MNRFLIDHHPDAIAKAMCDKHIVKMPTEEAQMLSHVLHHYMGEEGETMAEFTAELDRKSTRLNSSHGYISYAVFCLKKKKKKKRRRRRRK